MEQDFEERNRRYQSQIQEFCLMHDTLMSKSVSYTHLDVYKRQAWYGTQLIKEMKELYKWYKKRADDNSPAPTNTTEQDIRPSSSDTTITVEKNKDCNININVYPKLDK